MGLTAVPNPQAESPTKHSKKTAALPPPPTTAVKPATTTATAPQLVASKTETTGLGGAVVSQSSLTAVEMGADLMADLIRTEVGRLDLIANVAAGPEGNGLETPDEASLIGPDSPRPPAPAPPRHTGALGLPLPSLEGPGCFEKPPARQQLNSATPPPVGILTPVGRAAREADSQRLKAVGRKLADTANIANGDLKVNDDQIECACGGRSQPKRGPPRSDVCRLS